MSFQIRQKLEPVSVRQIQVEYRRGRCGAIQRGPQTGGIRGLGDSLAFLLEYRPDELTDGFLVFNQHDAVTHMI